MRYYPNAALALDRVREDLPSWVPPLPAWDALWSYFEAVPVDFSVFGFGLECHLIEERVDAGVAFPVSAGRHELMQENLELLWTRLGRRDEPTWAERVFEPARRVSALGRLHTRGIRAFCLCMDQRSLGARSCPDLVYLSLHNLHILRDPSQLLWCPPLARVVEALFGDRPARGADLLERMTHGAEAWPSVRLAHLGVARVEAGGKLKPYVHGRVDELRRLLSSPALPRRAGFDAPLELLARLAQAGGDATTLTLMLGSGAELERLDVEIHPGPCFDTALELAGEAGAKREQLDEIRGLAAGGVRLRPREGWAPVASRLTHLKVSLEAGRRPSWKAYFVVRQGG